LQAKKPAWRFHALDLIGVAAAVCAAVSAHPTKPIVASELAEANPPAACPPQWLPVLVATASSSGLLQPYAPNPGCTPRYEFNDSLSTGVDPLAPRGDATWFLTVKFQNATIGFLANSAVNESTSCDQLAAIAINNQTNEEVVLGTSTLIEEGYQLGWTAAIGEEIQFRYWNGEEEKEYFVLERFKMVAESVQGSFENGSKILEVQEIPPCKCQLCTKYVGTVSSMGLSFNIEGPLNIGGLVPRRMRTVAIVTGVLGLNLSSSQ